MGNQLEEAKKGNITPQMKEVARQEGVNPEVLRRKVEEGRVIILTGRFNHKRVVGVGEGLATKVNASVGTSTDICDI